MIVDVGLLGVVLFFAFQRVIMGVHDGCVIMLMRVPECAMLPLCQEASSMMMRDVIVIMSVDLRVVTVFRFLPLSFRALYSHCDSPLLYSLSLE